MPVVHASKAPSQALFYSALDPAGCDRCGTHASACATHNAEAAGPYAGRLCAITLTSIAALPAENRYHAQDGHYYDKQALARWLSGHNTSPLTRQLMPRDVLCLRSPRPVLRVQPPWQHQLADSRAFQAYVTLGCGALVLGAVAEAFGLSAARNVCMGCVGAFWGVSLGLVVAHRRQAERGPHGSVFMA